MDNLPSPARGTDLTDLGLVLRQVTRAGVVSGYAANDDEKQAIRKIYDDYDNASGVGEGLDFSGLAADLLEALHDGYTKTYSKGALKHIRSVLMSQAKRCPICGIGPAKELDHYLPRADYRALSIYVRNLVPICHDCNNSKKKHGTGAADKRFIHAYFDELPERHLAVELSIENQALLAQYGVSELGAQHVEIGQRISYQLERLKVNDRWNDEIIVYLTGQATALEDAFNSGGAGAVSVFGAGLDPLFA